MKTCQDFFATIQWDKIAKMFLEKEEGTSRKPHYISKPKHTPQTPRRAVFFDSESIVPNEGEIREHEPYLICAIFRDYERNSTRKTTYGSEKAQKWKKDIKPLEKFWEDLAKYAKKKDLTWVFAHNVGYDLLATGATPKLFDMGYKSITYPYEKGSTFIWELAKPNKEPRFCENCKPEKPCRTCQRIRKNLYNIRFVSSSNYFVEPLAKLGEIFGTEKLHQGEDEKINFAKLDEYPLDMIETYCARDTEIVQKAMESLFDVCNQGQISGFGSFKNTLPSIAFSAYRTHYMPKDTLNCHALPEVLSLERAAYYGGRTELWKRGEMKNLHYVDINSMYPYVMKTHPYPVKLINYSERETTESLQDYLNQNYALVSLVLLDTPENTYPKRYNKRLVFPTGTFTTVLSTPEIVYALEKEHIKKVLKTAIYEQDYIFTNYIDHFYNARIKAREEGNPVLDKVYKLMLNSLYGKFGQLKREFIEVGECDTSLNSAETINDIDEEGNLLEVNMRYFGGKIYAEHPIEDVAHNSVIPIASHVTAYARMLLWDYIQIVGIENHFYNDTDSLFVNQKGYENLIAKGAIDSKRLGALGLVSSPESINLRNVKDYVIDGKKTLKGISKSAEKIAEDTYSQLQWRSFSASLNQGKLDSFANKTIIKKVSGNYLKGNISETGEVIPFVFDSDEIVSEIK